MLIILSENINKAMKSEKHLVGEDFSEEHGIFSEEYCIFSLLYRLGLPALAVCPRSGVRAVLLYGVGYISRSQLGSQDGEVPRRFVRRLCSTQV